MNEFGEPNMGNPSVRFDEGRERVGHWPVCLSIQPLPPTLQSRMGSDFFPVTATNTIKGAERFGTVRNTSEQFGEGCGLQHI